MVELCYVCLILGTSLPSNPPVTSVKGTPVCFKHVRYIANADLLAIPVGEEDA